MKTKTVYRVENKSGDGPYISDTNFPEHINIILNQHSDCPKHKCFQDDLHPFDDIKIHERAFGTKKEIFYCGFKSMQDLFSWFGGLIKFFYKNTDFRIVKYTVPTKDIFYTLQDNQLSFVKPKKSNANKN